MPRPTYRLAMDTTSRRLASASFCLAISPFLKSFFQVASSSAEAVTDMPPSRWCLSSASFSAASFPADMAWARSTSSSGVSRGTLPISLRYIRTGSSKEKLLTRVLGSTSSSSSTSAISSAAGSSSGRSRSSRSSELMSMFSASRESYSWSIWSPSRLRSSTASISSADSSLPFFLPRASSSRSFSLPLSQLAAGRAATCLSSSRRMPAFLASSSVGTRGSSASPFFPDVASGLFSSASAAASSASACCSSSMGVNSFSLAMKLSSSTFLVLAFFYSCRQRIASAIVSPAPFLQNGGYVVSKCLPAVFGRFWLLTYSGNMAHLL